MKPILLKLFRKKGKERRKEGRKERESEGRENFLNNLEEKRNRRSSSTIRHYSITGTRKIQQSLLLRANVPNEHRFKIFNKTFSN